jgi:hypothetical protein
MIRLNPFCRAGFPAALSLPIVLLACSSDGHGPVIGAPNTPIVISEGGGSPSAGTGNPNGGGAGMATGGGTGVAGTNATGTGGGGGTPTFDPFGVGGDNPFGTGSPGFGAVGGSDPFGTSGTSNTSGTASF